MNYKHDKLIIALFCFTITALLMVLSSGCNHGVKDRIWHCDEFIACEGRSICQDDDPSICFVPRLNAYMMKVRIPPIEGLIDLSLVSFSWYAPNWQEQHQEPDWNDWSFYKQAIIYGSGGHAIQPLRFYFDRNSDDMPIPTICGDFESNWWVDNPAKYIDILEHWTDEHGRQWVRGNTWTIY